MGERTNANTDLSPFVFAPKLNAGIHLRHGTIYENISRRRRMSCQKYY